MTITSLNPSLKNLQIQSDEVDSLLTEVNQHTLSTKTKVLGVLGIFVGWVYLAYQSWQKSASLEKLKPKVLGMDMSQKDIPDNIRTVHNIALQVLGDKLTPLDMEAAKFTHVVAKEIKAIFWKETTEEAMTSRISLYSGMARSLETNEDLAKFRQLPASAKRISYSYEHRITKQKKEINEVIDEKLLETVWKKLKDTDNKLKANPALSQYFADKFGQRMNKDRIIDNIIELRIPNTSKSFLFEIGAVFFQNIFNMLETSKNDPKLTKYNNLSEPDRNQLFCIANQLAQSSSAEVSFEHLPEILDRVAKLIKKDKGTFLLAYNNWAKQAFSERVTSDQFLNDCESKGSFIPKDTTPRLPDLDAYDVEDETVVSLNSNERDSLEDLDDYQAPISTTQDKGWIGKGLSYLNSFTSAFS